MTDPILNPPGVIQEAESLDTVARLCNLEHAANEDGDRKKLLRAKKIGDWLNDAKSRCGHNNWVAWVQKNIKFSHRQANRYMKVAENWSKLDGPSNLEQALKALLVDEPNDPPPLALTEQPRINPPLCFVCSRAVRTGQTPKKNCKECKEVREEAEKPPDAPEEEREPGVDEEEPEAPPKPTSDRNRGGRPKSGSEMVTPAHVIAILGKAGAEVDKAAHQFGLERNGRPGQAPSVIETPEIMGIKRLLKEAETAVEAFFKAAKKSAKDRPSTQGE